MMTDSAKPSGDNMISGIYVIQNWVNDKTYIGSSKNIKKRWAEHINSLNGNYHGNLHLQNAWDDYGYEMFIFRVLEETNKLIEREQYWMDISLSANRKYGYNIIPKSDRSETSLETRKKQSEVKKGKRYSPQTEFKKGQKPWNKNIPYSKEIKQKCSIANKGKRYSPKTEFKKGAVPWNKNKRGMQIPWNKGKTGVYSDEIKEKISKTLTGNIPWNKGKKTGQIPWNKGMIIDRKKYPKYGNFKKGVCK